MLIQHLLTERIFRKIFNNAEFRTRNVVAAEIEKVITELTKRAFNRDEFLRGLDRFYKAIEQSAENTTGFTEKQAFLNKVYQRFFQGYSPKEADTHGIVYTPQPIVNFMVRSVEETLQKEFGRSLSDKGVHILDPFVGTGNFIIRIMQEIKTTALPYKYENELHCNEVMLLPYYIASMNIEHAYYERTNEYRSFPGICLVDTFELAEKDQASLGFMNAENAERVVRQKKSPIFVITGNPPYNAWQINENDNNKKRQYEWVDTKISELYAKTSEATNKSALSDMYVKAFMWASQRIGEEGVVAFVTNNGFFDGIAFDGMRKNLASNFSAIYHLDLKGNARTSGARRRREGGNVFEDAIRVGIGITLLVRKAGKASNPMIRVYHVADNLNFRAKQIFLEDHPSVSAVSWESVSADSRGHWFSSDQVTDFDRLLPIGSGDKQPGAFAEYTPAPNTARDAWVYSFQLGMLRSNVELTARAYNEHVLRWSAAKRMSSEVDGFVDYDDAKISWSRDLKKDMERGHSVKISQEKFRKSLYRPYSAQNLFFDRVLIEEVYRLPQILPKAETANDNRLICLTSIGSEKPFMAVMTNLIPNYHLAGAGCGTQVFPFYSYAEDGTNRRENITDWALEQFRSHYGDPSITKWDIFHYVYAVLHHPEYRERYAANLRRELPRIPFVSANSPTLSSRAEPSGAKKELSSRAKSRDLVFSQQHDEHARSFDSVTGRASAPSHSAQDDRAGEMRDVEIFRAFVKAGQRLAEIHVHYEQQPEYPLTKKEKEGEKLDYRVQKMKLSKDKTTLTYNQFLTLSGIPKETYEYRLGNRSALEWVIDQYQVSIDKRSGITNDPNRSDDPTYILRLLGQVITVSLETVKIVQGLPALGLAVTASDATEAV
jgi:predicted helicase